MHLKHISVLFALLSLLGLPHAWAGESLILNSSSHSLSTPEHNGILDAVYQKLADKLGISIQIQFLPAERALLNANAGIDDGEICRVASIAKTYPNLLQVPGALMPIKLMAFSKNFNFTVSGFESVRPYRLGIMIGRKVLEEKVTGAKSLTKYATDKEIIDALENNQIDIGIIERSQGIRLIESDSSIQALKPPIYQDECYLYLNKKHAAWVPRFAEEIKKMKQDGSLQKMLNEGFRPFLKGEQY